MITFSIRTPTTQAGGSYGEDYSSDLSPEIIRLNKKNEDKIKSYK
jgi:hypothetical protein